MGEAGKKKISTIHSEDEDEIELLFFAATSGEEGKILESRSNQDVD